MKLSSKLVKRFNTTLSEIYTYNELLDDKTFRYTFDNEAVEEILQFIFYLEKQSNIIICELLIKSNMSFLTFSLKERNIFI